jgi:hypothetical protein
MSVASRPDCYGMMTRSLQRFVVIGCKRHCYLFSVSRLAAPQNLFPNQPLGRFGRLFQFLQERVSQAQAPTFAYPYCLPYERNNSLVS